MEQRDEIYLDYAAATPVDQRVFVAMEPYFSLDFYNPSSPYAPAVRVRREYEAAKRRLATVFGANADEVIVTGGATESINLAFNTAGGHVVVSAIEHPAVLEAAMRQSSSTVVQPTEKGIITAQSIGAAIQPDTQLVSVQIANNELGTIQPLREIASIIQAEKRARAIAGNATPLLFHTDASQGFGQLDVHVARLGVDMLSLNSGKMYGPKGVGLLWATSTVRVNPLVVGGGQERGLRSGTENVAGVMGFAKAAEIAASYVRSEHIRLAKLRDDLQERLVAAFPDAILLGHIKKRLAGHLHISFPGLDGERLVFLLEIKNIYVATGSACAANKGTRSHVLVAIGASAQIADGSLRISLGRKTTSEQITKAATILIETVKSEYARVSKK